MTEKKQPQSQSDLHIDDEIKSIKNGDQWRNQDHVADWYAEKCTSMRTEERIREFNDNRDR